uniref:Uncharacterized protein n=1 Tax=Populus alba TaxID=43335 RepID=A0A4U5Q8I2_POPAL|nr:hypothetical protein D5086_0000122320 [Populus alba]
MDPSVFAAAGTTGSPSSPNTNLLHRCCSHPPSAYAAKLPSLDVMAMTPLLIGAKEKEEAGEVTLASIITSTLASLTMEIEGAPPGRTPGATTAAKTKRATLVASAA